jgi:hypothetical protein
MTQSCKDVLTSEFMIYSNDFESNDLSNISGGQFIDFNKSKVLGNFNNDGFRLTLENIPEHTHVLVSFDLYIHDSWDGNTNELNPPGEDHDAWFMEFDQDEKRKASEKILFETTFSNGECLPARCLDQSYPNSFPFVRNPRAGSVRDTRLRGLCHLSSDRFGTSLYRFERSFRTERGSLTIDFYDKLLQTNSPDPKCDESWSMDNLVIKAQIID